MMGEGGGRVGGLGEDEEQRREQKKKRELKEGR